MRKDDIMELGAYFKSIIDQDRAAVVICSLDHKIIYMNPAAAAIIISMAEQNCLAKAFWTATGHIPTKESKKSLHGLPKAKKTISYIHLIMKNRTKMYIWWHFVMQIKN